MFDWLADAATEFISWFQRGAETFNGLVVGIVPLLIVLLRGRRVLARTESPHEAVAMIQELKKRDVEET